MSNWIRFTNNNKESFGTLDGDDITVYEGNLFDNPTAVSYTHLRAHET